MWAILALATIAAVASFEISISTTNDDVEERYDGSWRRDCTSSDLEFDYDNNLDREGQKVGLRFHNIPVSYSQTIFDAYLGFKVDESHYTTLVLGIQVELSSNGADPCM